MGQNTEGRGRARREIAAEGEKGREKGGGGGGGGGRNVDTQAQDIGVCIRKTIMGEEKENQD